MQEVVKRRLLAAIMAVLLVISALPVASFAADAVTEDDWIADWTEINQYGMFTDETIVLYRNPFEAEDFYQGLKSDLPDTFTVQYSYTDTAGALWYLIDTENWAEAYGFDSNYGYVNAESVILFGNVGTDTVVGTVKIDGMTIPVTAAGLPEGATLNLSVIETSSVTPAVGTFAISLDISVTDGEDTNWQPEDGKTVTVTIPVSILGFSDSAAFFVYHVHDGETKILGPYTVSDGCATFEVDGFSEFVISIEEDAAQGDTKVTLKEDVESVDVYQNPFGLDNTNEKVTLTADQLSDEYFVYFRFTDDEGNVWFYMEFGDLTDYGYSLAENFTVVENDLGITFEDIPDGTIINWSLLDQSKIDAVEGSIVSYEFFKNIHNVNVYGVSMTLFSKDDLLNPIQPDSPITVRISDIWNTEWDYPVVDIYHILDSANAIEEARNNGALLLSTDADLLELYEYEASLVGGAGVPYEILTSKSDTSGVTLNEDGSVSFLAESFSDYYWVSGDANSLTIKADGGKGGNNNDTIYIVPGVNGTVTVNTSNNVSLSVNKAIEGVTITKSGQEVTVSASEDAVVGTEGEFVLEWKNNDDKYRTATITVKVVDKEEYLAKTYTDNEIGHIQINVSTIAIVLTNTETGLETYQYSIDLGFTSSQAQSNSTVTKVSDPDSAVGYYYTYTYYQTDDDGNYVKDADGNNIPVTITIRLDETVDYPVDVSELDFTITGVTYVSDEDQISFNGSFSVGTAEVLGGTEVRYIVTIETEYEGEDLTLKDTISYWDNDNVCGAIIGKGNDYHGSTYQSWLAGSFAGSQSGIDIAKFSAGYTDASGNVYYVVYSDLTKTVVGYDFGSGDTKERNFTFTIYRRTAATDSSAAGEWTAVDMVTITTNTATTKTSLTTNAGMYVGYIDGYEYKIVETGNTISGYACDVSFSSGNDFSIVNDGMIFTWNTTKELLDNNGTEDESDDTYTIIYYVEISCKNTYEKLLSGLTIEKQLVDTDGETVNSSDYFKVTVTPSSLELDEGASGFNGKSFTYTINGSASYSVTASSPASGFGSLTLYIKAGDIINITGLPVGTYTVTETSGVYYADINGSNAQTDTGDDAKYTYDSTTYSKNLSSTTAGAKVTLKNTSNAPSVYTLTIEKKLKENTAIYSADDIFIFDVVIIPVNGTKINLTVSLRAGESVTIVDIPAGATYTVTERENWRYTAELPSNATGTLNSDVTVTVTNTLSDEDYLSDTHVVTNEFTRADGNTVVTQTVYNDDGSYNVTTYTYTYNTDGTVATTTTVIKKYDKDGEEITEDSGTGA